MASSIIIFTVLEAGGTVYTTLKLLLIFSMETPLISHVTFPTKYCWKPDAGLLFNKLGRRFYEIHDLY